MGKDFSTINCTSWENANFTASALLFYTALHRQRKYKWFSASLTTQYFLVSSESALIHSLAFASVIVGVFWFYLLHFTCNFHHPLKPDPTENVLNFLEFPPQCVRMYAYVTFASYSVYFVYLYAKQLVILVFVVSL